MELTRVTDTMGMPEMVRVPGSAGSPGSLRGPRLVSRTGAAPAGPVAARVGSDRDTTVGAVGAVANVEARVVRWRLDPEELAGAHELLCERMADLHTAYEQLVAGALRVVPCDPALQHLIETSLHDLATATRRTTTVFSRHLSAAAVRSVSAADGTGAATTHGAPLHAL